MRSTSDRSETFEEKEIQRTGYKKPWKSQDKEQSSKKYSNSKKST